MSIHTPLYLRSLLRRVQARPTRDRNALIHAPCHPESGLRVHAKSDSHHRRRVCPPNNCDAQDTRHGVSDAPFVTGAGFIGSHVVLKLAREHPEYKVRAQKSSIHAEAT